jgi:hypothetical protein
MSSPKRAAGKARPPARATLKNVSKPAAAVTLSSQALQLAAAVQRELASGRSDVLTQDAVQALMTAACRTYSAQVDAGDQYLPVGSRDVTSTDALVTSSGLLRATNLAVFELGLWQSWTGR